MENDMPKIEWYFILERNTEGALNLRVSNGAGWFRTVSLARWGKIGQDEAVLIWKWLRENIEGDLELPF